MKIKKFATVVEAFMNSLEKRPGDIALHVIDPNAKEFAISYQDLYRGACGVMEMFRESGIRRGQRGILILPTSPDFFYIYFAALWAGVAPIMMNLPRSNRPLDTFLPFLERMIQKIGAQTVITLKEVIQAEGFDCSVKTMTGQDLCRDNGKAEPTAPSWHPRHTDIAHLQATSGSTGSPRVAVVGHGNIAENVKGIGAAIRHRESDILLSWLPLSHDMGLIGISYALYWQCPLVMSEPVNFIRNPINWLRFISRYKGTLSPAPNSAFQICARLGQMRTFSEIDLSSWRVALCGAEPIHADTIRQFIEIFTPYGFQAKTLLPVYGLAEATLAATIPDVNAVPWIETIDARLMETEGRCIPATPGAKRKIDMVSLGPALPGHQLRIVDKNGSPLKERCIGEVEFYGPSVIGGYWEHRQDQEQNASLKREDGYLRTGDLGYVAGRELYVTGRVKDIIITHGRNIIPNQVEEFIQRITGGKTPNSAAVCGIRDEKTKTEMIHVIIEHRGVLPEPERQKTENTIRDAMEETYSLTGITIHWVGKGQIPKTTSGKIQRHICREMIRTRWDGKTQEARKN
jgi:acyl-CoA synthetase (AMP-forming)/AMP-acid ligase II